MREGTASSSVHQRDTRAIEAERRKEKICAKKDLSVLVFFCFITFRLPVNGLITSADISIQIQ